MAFAKADQESKAWFAEVLPGDPHIQVKPMFGHTAAFINGNMFAGVYGTQLFLRLPEAERVQLIDEEEASEFAPMPGRPMKEYVVAPDSWRHKPETASMWLEKALFHVGAMPPKEPKKKKAAKE